MAVNAGIKIINDNGSVLINDSYMNFALNRKVKVSTLPYWFADVKEGYMVEGSKFSFRKIVLGESESIAFLGGINSKGSLDGFIAKDLYAASLNQNAYYIVLRQGVDASSLYVYIFGEFNKVGGGNQTYGLEIFDESANLVFSSNKKPLRVLHHGITEDNYKVPSSKKIAINTGNVYIAIPASEIGDPYTPLYIDGHYSGDEDDRDMLMFYMSRYFKSSVPTIVNGRIKKTEFSNEHEWGIDAWNGRAETWDGFVYTVIDVTNY